jgi:hypothetical protein
MAGEYTRSAAAAQPGKVTRKYNTLTITKSPPIGRSWSPRQLVIGVFGVRFL